MTASELISRLEKINPTAQVTVKLNFTDRYNPITGIESRYIPARCEEYVEISIEKIGAKKRAKN